MITLEQIRLLEGKITRAIELIRVLKEENATLRRGLDSAQKRMRELESLVEGFKADQKEIESAILRTLRTLDELEESGAGAARKSEHAATPVSPAQSTANPAPPRPQPSPHPAAPRGQEPEPTKEELDIF
jgi:FtsZ-binding cell division protein ZapB